MAAAPIEYTGPTAFDINLQNLAASATFVQGQESDEIDNTSTLFTDAIVSGRIWVGTSPGTTGTIAVYVWGSDVAASTRPIDTLVGVDGNRTLVATGMLGSLRLGAAIGVNLNTTDVDWPVPAFSVAALFGGNMPRFWGLFVTHSTAAPLRNHADNDNPLSYVGIKYGA